MIRELIERVRNDFTFHVVSERQRNQMQLIRTNFENLAVLLVDNVDQSRELSTALTKLEEAMFWANAGISRRG